MCSSARKTSIGFPIRFYRDDLPEWFQAEDLASVICALEALAQFALCLLLIEEVEPESRPACLGRMILRQQCDNQGVVGASARGASMTQPLCGVLQATAKLCLSRASRSTSRTCLESGILGLTPCPAAARCCRISGLDCSRPSVIR